MFYLWFGMASRLRGFDYHNSSDLRLKGLSIIPAIFKSRSQQFLEELRRIPYLCGWSFRSLRNDRANVAMDLQHFHELCRAQFGSKPATCNPGSSQCDGRSSRDCRRFKDTRAENQSLHDYKCEGSCPRLFWGRESFTSVLGPRAVDISSTDSYTLNYCKLSENTLTVSHVWSHGQGGRPDKVGVRVQASIYVYIADTVK